MDNDSVPVPAVVPVLSTLLGSDALVGNGEGVGIGKEALEAQLARSQAFDRRAVGTNIARLTRNKGK